MTRIYAINKDSKLSFSRNNGLFTRFIRFYAEKSQKIKIERKVLMTELFYVSSLITWWSEG